MKTLEEIRAIREQLRGTISMRFESEEQVKVVVAMGEEGLQNGARTVLSAIGNQVQKDNLIYINVTQDGSIASGGNGPVVVVTEPGKDSVTYNKVTPDQAVEIVKAIAPRQINKEA